MGSPITFSGFNQVDFNLVLNAIMTQESQPLTALQTRQKALQSTDTAYGQLATRLSTLQSASAALSKPSTLISYAATSSDDAAVKVSASSGAVAGNYDVVVNELARAQVTASSSTSPDADTTVVANGGTLTIGGVATTLAGPVTLNELAVAINANTASPANASIIETSPGAFRLVLTGKSTGTANAFTVQNALTSSTVAFTDTDNDGSSGDSAADNAAQAINASVTINSIAVTSSSNVLASGIPGVSVTLLQKDPAKTVAVTVERDDTALADRIEAFVTAYNDLVKFANEQSTAAGKGAQGTLGRDALLRTLRNELRSALSAQHGTSTFTKLAEIGLGFTRTGELKLDRTALSAALATAPADVTALFADATTGAFKAVDSLVTLYTKSGGLVPDARTRLSDEIARLNRRMDDMQARLAVRRASLQKEFIAADLAMTRLNAQKGALTSFSQTLAGNSL